MLTGKAYDTVTLQVPYGAPSSTMFTEAPEIPAEERMLFARERADGRVPLDGGDPDGFAGGAGQDVPGHPRPAEFGDPDQQEEKHREHEGELHQTLPADRFVAPTHRCFPVCGDGPHGGFALPVGPGISHRGSFRNSR